MKVILLHPPMYSINHKFYNLLAKEVDLIVYQFGEHPVYHKHWTSDTIRQDKLNYKLKIYGKGHVTNLKLLNPSFILDIVKEKPDIVLSIAFWIPNVYIAILKSICRFKFLILTNTIDKTEKNSSRLKNFFRQYMASKTDLFISASDLTTNYLKSQFPNTNIVLSTQTMDVTLWKEQLSELQLKDELRKKLSLPKNKKIMLGVGNFIEKKNWKSVLNSLDNIENIYFILIGSGEQQKEYESIINEKKLKNKVKLVSRKDGKELLEYFKASDFFIFPSYYDQFGFVVPEALASGLPVICTKNAGTVTFINHLENGYIVNPYDDFQEAILYTIKNLNLMENKAFKSIEHFTIENRVQEFVEILRGKNDDIKY